MYPAAKMSFFVLMPTTFVGASAVLCSVAILAGSRCGKIEGYHEFGKSADRKDGTAKWVRRRTKELGHM